MFGFSTLSNLFTNVIQTKFVSGVYHSVVMKPGPSNKGIKPAAIVDNKILYVGVDDTKGFSCYCRQTGPLTVDKSEHLGSCNGKLYKTIIPHRLVFFNDSESRNHEQIIATLIRAVIGSSKIVLTGVQTLADLILKQEAPTGRFNFKAQTFYIAIDFFVLLDLKADNCEQEITCEGIQNPFCG